MSAFAGKIAMVTGAARGIGRAVVQQLLAEGAEHVISADVLADTLAELPTDERHSTCVLDVTDESAWAQRVTDIIDRHGRIDVLVNNAGILVFGTLEETAPDDFRRLLEVNVTGTLLGMQAVIPAMKAQGSGAIVNLSSASGMQPSNFVGAYAASKFAVRGLTRAAALELGPEGIRVNSVHPGGVNTPMTNPGGASSEDLDKGYRFVPAQRGCQPEEIAGAVCYLASDAAAYCNGSELVIDGGMTAGVYFPGLPGAPISLA